MTAILVTIVSATLVQQALAYAAELVLPNMAPAVAADLRINPYLIGYYTGIIYFFSSLGQVSCGGFILRFGAVRMSQLSLLFIGLALMLGYFGAVWAFALGAALIGLGSSVSTPASSHLLARYSPPKYAPLIFSVKQAGVPVGGLMAGVLVPFLLGWIDWRGAFLFCGAMCVIYAVILQPIRERFDADRQRSQSLKPGFIWKNIEQVLSTPALLELAVGMFCFVGLQGLFASYFVTYVTGTLERSLDAANYFFSIAMTTAIGARIFWGWVGSALLPARRTISYLAFVMVIATTGMGWLGTGQSDLAIITVSVLYCISAISWHGLMLSEVARLAPAGQVGPTTGACLAFANAGMMTYPIIFAILGELTGALTLGFYLAALPTLAMAFKLYLPPKTLRGVASQPQVF